MISGMVPAMSLRQELVEAKAENAALRLELGVHTSGLKKRLDAFGAAWGFMRQGGFEDVIRMRMNIHNESLAEACEAVWVYVLTKSQRDGFIALGEMMIESQEAFAQ